jgi:hypothetical protein
MTDVIPQSHSRDDVVNAWRHISAQGFGDPAEISETLTGKPQTEEMLAAERLYNAWYEEEKAKPRTPEEALRFSFDTSLLYVDAGFIGRDYLDEVANDWLTQDAQAAEDQGFTELANQINAKINEINKQLDEG